MAVFVVVFLLLLTMAGYSDANFCVCIDGLADAVLQKNIDYACGILGDCTQIQQNGPCFNPNTVKNHCDYAVNSYYQRKNQTAGSCSFQGTANVAQTAPPTAPGSVCVYTSIPSTGAIPTTGPPTAGGTPTTGPPTAGGTPTTGTPTTGTPTTGGTPNMGGTTVPGSTTTPTFGLGPTASGFPSTDNSAGVKLLDVPFTLVSISIILINGLICPRI